MKSTSNSESNLLLPSEYFTRGITTLTVGSLFIVVVSFILLIRCSVVNLPIQDDYDTALRFLIMVHENSTFEHVVRELFVQQTEHRIAFQKLIYLIYHSAFGALDFSRLALIGNCALLLLAVAIIQALSGSMRDKLISFVPLSFILFQPQYFDSLVWSTAGLANFWSIACAILSFVTLQRLPTLFGGTLAFIFALLSSLSQGCGVFTLVGGGAFLVHQRRFRDSAAWVLAATVSLYLYFSGYQSVGGGQAPMSDAIYHPLKMSGYFLGFLGSGLSFDSTSRAIGAGALLLMSFFAVSWKRFDRTHPALYFLILFLLAAAGINTLARTSFGVEYALSQPRYRFFSSVTIALLLHGIVTTYPVPLVRRTATIGAVLFWLTSYWIYGIKGMELKVSTLESFIRPVLFGQGTLAYYHPPAAHGLLDRAERYGIYSVAQAIQNETSSLVKLATRLKFVEADDFHVSVDAKDENSKWFYTRGWSGVPATGRTLDKTSILVRGTKDDYLADVQRVLRPDVAKALGRVRLLRSGFMTSFALTPLSHDASEPFNIFVVGSRNGVLIGKRIGSLSVQELSISESEL